MSSKQYNEIHDEYDEWRECLDAYIEKENVKASLTSLIQGASVLELACGSGFYTFDLIKWGAKSVVAVDISDKMIAAALAHLDYQQFKSQVDLRVADVSVPTMFAGAPFEVVVAGWLLTYAHDCDTLSRMFQTIAMNLKEGGRFVTTVIRPSSNPESAIRSGDVSFWSPDNYCIDVRHPVTDGAAIRCHAKKASGRSTYWDSFYLKQEIYEAAARKAGMKGKIEYQEPRVPEFISSANPSSEMTQLVEGETSLHFNLLIVSK